MASTINASTSPAAIVQTADGTGILALQTAGTTAVTVTASQNVGIGTASPSAKLHVSGNSSNIVASFDKGAANQAGVHLKNSTQTYTTYVDINNDGTNWWSLYDANNDDLIDVYVPLSYRAFYTVGTERMRIDSSGNMLVGETTQRGRISATTGSDECIFAINTAGAASATMCSWNQANSGNNYFHAFFTDTGANNVGNIDYNRGAGLVRYQTTSDATLKNIIGDSNGQRSLEILNTTRIREFAWKSDVEQKPQIGVIAQELYETYKGAVSVGGEDGEGKYKPWGVDKTAFTFHLIAGWQEHQRIIQEQQALITSLTARITALEGA